MTLREEKINSLLKRLLSEFFTRSKVSNCLVTVTEIDISKDLKFAKIFVSVYPDKESLRVLKILKKRGGEMRRYVGDKAKMKHVPFFEFQIDKGEINRQRINELLEL
ncbi:MAG: 30S ribosome-binding factor RbfA [Candidatus Marinimicrobia bacterium]|nr:30S ribosome-binding factor RbfA [Candidatus Neomarinimicrobiota bacterium]